MHKLDMKLQKKDNIKKAQIFEQFEKDAARKHKQVITKIKKQKIYYKIQFAIMKKEEKILLLSDNKQNKY